MGRSEILAGLRQSLGRLEGRADGPGVQSSGLQEVVADGAGAGAAASGFAAGLAHGLARGRTVLWIGEDFAAAEYGEICAEGWLELGLDPSALLLLRVARAADGLRAAEEGLACAGLGAVVLEIQGAPKVLDLTATRRLALAVERGGAGLVLLRLGARAAPSAAAKRWLVGPAPSGGGDGFGAAHFAAALLRNRQGPCGRWVMQWNGDERSFHHRAAQAGLAVAAASADRPVAAAQASTG